jgi:hypothetical protein
MMHHYYIILFARSNFCRIIYNYMDIFDNDNGGYINYDPDDYPSGDFKSLVEEHNLLPEFEVSEDCEGFLVTETWSSFDDNIVANRYYYFDVFYVDLIDERIRTNILEHMLSIHLEREEYEDAAILRDLLK